MRVKGGSFIIKVRQQVYKLCQASGNAQSLNQTPGMGQKAKKKKEGRILMTHKKCLTVFFIPKCKKIICD